jgi:hypothetical protein
MDCARNIITANFSGGGTSATTAPLWQWDYNQVLCITGIDLPAAFEVHFSTNRTGGVSTTAVGADGQVTIPNVLLAIGKNLNAWIYLSDAQGEGETEYSILIPVKARPMPETYDAEVSGEFDDVVRQVSEYAETAQTAADNAGASATAAAASADSAAASASAAEAAKTAAETAQAGAEAAKDTAVSNATTATTKAAEAAQSASSAAQSKADAEAAATRAEQAAASLTVDSALSDTSVNPVQNKVVTESVTQLKSAIDEFNGGSINLLNPADFQQGKYIVTSGGLADNASLTASGFFQVNENTTYYIYRSDTRPVRVAYYSTNSESGYIGLDSAVTASTNTFTTRQGSKYVRISADSTMILDMGIYVSDIRYYIPYQLRLASGVSIENQIDDTLTEKGKAADAYAVGEIAKHVVISEKCVKFGESGMIVNERLDISNGKVVTNSSNQTRTDFIPVAVGDYVQTCAIKYICLYNDQYEYLGYINLWSSGGAIAPPSTYSGNYNSNIVQVEAINGVNPSYMRCWGAYNQYPPAVTLLSDDPYKVVNLGDSIFGNNEKPWDLGTYIQNITGLKDANCGYGGTTARVIPSGNMAPLGLPSIVDCIVSEDFSPLGTPAYWANLGEYRYGVPTLLFGMVDFSKIEVITIAYGTNDWNSNTPLDNTDNRLDTSTYKGGLRYAIENLQTAYPGITLIMLSPIYRYWSDSSDYSTVDRDSDGRTNSLGLKLIDYVTAMEEVADEYHLPYFNNYDNIGLNRYTASTWLRDGTHLNRGIGVDKMGHIVAREVNQIY